MSRILPAMNDNPIIQAKRLSIGYRQKKQARIVQDALDLEVNCGEMVCLIGPNGCGKSTLLRTLSGLQPALSGQLFIQGKDLMRQSIREKARLIAIVLTDRVEDAHLDVATLVATGRTPYTNWFNKMNGDDLEKAQDAIRKVCLQGYEKKKITELSDGERQRAMIAKALAQDTPVILLDEPTSHLDLPNRVNIMLLLRKLSQETNKAILLSTHELDLALQTCHKAWLMPPGKGIIAGTPRELMKNNSIQKVFRNDNFTFTGEGGSIHINLNANR